MSTKRTPILRPPQWHFTPAAIAAFRKLVALDYQDCGCPEGFCAACREQWLDQQQIIYTELKCALYEWYPVQHPDDPIPHWDAGNNLAIKVFRDAQARYCALAAAAGIVIERD
jgi:hypothetical protein